jgi:hypothetical protein
MRDWRERGRDCRGRMRDWRGRGRDCRGRMRDWRGRGRDWSGRGRDWNRGETGGGARAVLDMEPREGTAHTVQTQ